MQNFNFQTLPLIIILSIILSSCSPLLGIAAPLAPPLIPETAPGEALTPVNPQIPGTMATLLPTLTPIAAMIPVIKDDVWDRIQTNQKIVVGMSWDYPPFAFVDSDFQVTGLDIALVKELGKRLNIPIVIQNFSFEGLQGALQMNQIDLAVAAISITPLRKEQMSFSQVYYVNQTAILASADSTIPIITSLDQLADYRIGVQRGTTYESWAKTSLVEANILPANKLFKYQKTQDAVKDLEQNRVDLIVFGQATASYYSTQKGMRVVGTGLGQQDLAIAMRLSTPKLKFEVDRVMASMLTDGTILSLKQLFIQKDIARDLPVLIPESQSPQTSLSPSETTLPAACINAMKFVGHVTYRDSDMKSPPLLKPNEEFVKVWRLQNSGTCTWTPTYHLVYAYGNVNASLMGGQPVAMPGNILPGATADVAVMLTAPMAPYTYQGFWQMENDLAQNFGEVIWVGITTQSDSSSSMP
jgi:ABC-type amino acid transport substrate-binding protein